ncbi:hypothetical protein [Oceanibium sediminis]|uniref:hypothetical protein n=1 Tax=Oceanibium sediminis TaxID=2026339 RepID=UPI00130023B0|nr:hypothetical protein [Oceanibium sediminis]
MKQRGLFGPRLRRMPGRRIFVHARRDAAARIASGAFDFFNTLAELARASDIPIHVVHATPRSRADAAKGGRHLHVFYGGKPLAGPRILHACPTYLHGYWYCDPRGARHHSSIAAAAFDPDTIDPAGALALLGRLHGATVAANRSKYDQPARGGRALKPGGIAIFAQQPITATEGQFHIDMIPLIEAVLGANAGACPVYIKLHPRQRPDLAAAIRAFHAPDAGVEVVDVSVHDLLESCAFTVSQSSAAAFEGFIHQKPAILAGITDFAQNAVTITDARQMPAAMAEVEARAFDHARFLAWFLERQCLEPKAPDFPARLASRLGDAGFPLGPGAGG